MHAQLLLGLIIADVSPAPNAQGLLPAPVCTADALFEHFILSNKRRLCQKDEMSRCSASRPGCPSVETADLRGISL